MGNILNSECLQTQKQWMYCEQCNSEKIKYKNNFYYDKTNLGHICFVCENLHEFCVNTKGQEHFDIVNNIKTNDVEKNFFN